MFRDKRFKIRKFKIRKFKYFSKRWIIASSPQSRTSESYCYMHSYLKRPCQFKLHIEVKFYMGLYSWNCYNN